MGTNYYFEEPNKDDPTHPLRLHIGKSSYGWCFSLHIIPELNINNLDDWLLYIIGRIDLYGYRIVDEYNDHIGLEKLISTITERSYCGPSPPEIPGPNGLSRHTLGRHCVEHGEGTWDLIIGDFS